MRKTTIKSMNERTDEDQVYISVVVVAEIENEENRKNLKKQRCTLKKFNVTCEFIPTLTRTQYNWGCHKASKTMHNCYA